MSDTEKKLIDLIQLLQKHFFLSKNDARKDNER